MVMSKNTTGWDILNKFSIYLSGRRERDGVTSAVLDNSAHKVLGDGRAASSQTEERGGRRLGGRRSARSAHAAWHKQES